MSNDETFTIVSVGAPLVEIDGDGPTTDRTGGVGVPDGVPTTAPLHLLNEWVRRWRVDAPPTTQASVSITDSPFGAMVGVRRCVAPPLKWWHPLAVDQWPRLRDLLRRHAPSLVALWYLYTDTTLSCTWKDIGNNDATAVNVRGGDLVIVTFVVP